MILYKLYTEVQGCILKSSQPPAEESNFIPDSRGSLWWQHPAVQSVKYTQVYSAGWCPSVWGHWEEKLSVFGVWKLIPSPGSSSLFLLTSYVTQSWLLRQSWQWRSPAARGRVQQTDDTCFQYHSEISWLQIQRSWKRQTGIFTQEQGDFWASRHRTNFKLQEVGGLLKVN